ncbi:MAG: DHH family phosphoesterase, partial [Spirochaetia bacterium]|nr:DHH family phosphoesterase [Spirochaetia bacterium]
ARSFPCDSTAIGVKRVLTQPVPLDLRSACAPRQTAGWYRLDDPGVVSDIADLLSQDFVQTSPVFVIAGEGEVCRVSARSPPGIDLNLDTVVRTAASSVGGSGGGHISRAGATIPHGKDDLFRQAVMEAMQVC